MVHVGSDMSDLAVRCIVCYVSLVSTQCGGCEVAEGDRRQETGDRRQETGDRRQETGDRRQETGDRRQEMVSVVCRLCVCCLSVYSSCVLAVC